MTCDPLAYTGPGTPLGPLIMLGIACVVVGAVVLLLARRRGSTVVVTLLLLISVAAVPINGGMHANAAGSDCPPTDNTLTVTQTSVLEGLAPGIAPVAITGIVVNVGIDATYITAIQVEITRVESAPGSAAGVCAAGDYVLLNARMPVGLALDPGGSTTFAGASIGFRDTSVNQDSCKGATLRLRYTANPD